MNWSKHVSEELISLCQQKEHYKRTCTYTPPSSSVHVYLEHCQVVEELRLRFPLVHLVLLGDYNLTTAVWSTLDEDADITQFVLDSRNKTFRVFAEAYKPIAAKSKPLIEQFYANITDSISLNQTRTKDTLAMGTSQLEALSRNLGSFFINLFPIIYKNIMLDNQDSQFTADYTQCLNNLMNNINPYDKLDQTVTQKVIHMLKSTRVLFNSIQYTMTKTREADEMFVQNLNKCESLVVKMNLCTWCSTDFNTRVRSIENSCWRYATNLATACLPSSREQLSKVWYSFMNTMASYVSSIEQSRLDVDIAGFLFALHNKISDVIMFSMQDTSNIDKKLTSPNSCLTPETKPSEFSPRPTNL
ncbi:uncharacterized protein LOC113471106 [Diaphorina citri]|uniref:Uncharacterized protein LOC113471106 n=1 Tax=Diaphorina citri TaxID=121845 RepID=A0A3Q0JBA6_DIACI|nr:uncharacterized protein LOC113471106 [Diaphorina citri]